MADVTLIANGLYTVPGFATIYLGGVVHGHLGPSNDPTVDLAPFHTAGTLSRFRAYITVNPTVSTTFTLRTRTSAGLGAQFVTILPGTTGIFEDLTNTDTVTPSGSPAVELWGYQSAFTGTPTASSITINQLSVVYTRAGNETPISYRQLSSSAMDGTRALTGTANHSSIESEIGLPIYDAGTCRRASVYIATNGRAAPTTITLRKNFVDTGIVITVGAGLTGWFYDTSNTVVVAKDDILTWVTSVAVGTFAGSHLGFEFVADSEAIPYRIDLGSPTGGGISGSSITTYLHAGGSLNAATAAERQSCSGDTFTVIGFRVYVTSSSGATTATTFTIQINGVDTAGVLTIPAVSPAVGWHSASMSTVVSPTDFIGIKYVALSTPPTISSIVLEPLGNSGPVVNAGPNQAVNLCVGATLAGSAVDPDGHAMTYLWTQDSGPASAVFADATDPDTTVTFPLSGVYVLKLTATDSEGATGHDTVQITVSNLAPVVNAGPDQDVQWPGVVVLTGSATDDGGGALTYLWTLISGPDAPTWADPTDPTTTVEFPTIGTYVLQLAASDCAATGTDTVTITMHEAPYPPPEVVTNRVMRRMRRAPHLSNEGNRITFDTFQVDLETGLGIADGQGEDPQIMLRWSDDGGQTWSPERWTSAGPQGAFKTRAVWRRLGQARDRVFEVTMTDPVPWRLIAAWIDVRMGRN